MSHTSRRDFLKILGMGAVATALFDSRLFPRTESLPKIGLQLYSVRKIIETDFDRTIRRLADTGFVGVETYPLPGSVDLVRAGKVIRESGLEVIAMHTPLPAGEQREVVLRMADAYRSDRVIFPGGPGEVEKYKSLDSRKQAVESYNEIAAFLKTRGLRFGLHNHWGEFEKIDGILPFYYLLDNLDREIFFEIDTYWARTAGRDPAEVLMDFGKRAPLLHIKDGPAVKGESIDEQLPAGLGVMDLPSIVKAGEGNIEWMIVEFDGYKKDIFDGISLSYAYLTKNGLAESKK